MPKSARRWLSGSRSSSIGRVAIAVACKSQSRNPPSFQTFFLCRQGCPQPGRNEPERCFNIVGNLPLLRIHASYLRTPLQLIVGVGLLQPEPEYEDFVWPHASTSVRRISGPAWHASLSGRSALDCVSITRGNGARSDGALVCCRTRVTRGSRGDGWRIRNRGRPRAAAGAPHVTW